MSTKIPTLFAKLEWTSQDKTFAQREGWDIFDIDSTGVLEIQKTEESPHITDTEARSFVSKRAADGSSLHLKALCMLAKSIVEQQLETCCDGYKDVASDILSGDKEYQRNGNMCTSWAVDIRSQLTILRSAI